MTLLHGVEQRHTDEHEPRVVTFADPDPSMDGFTEEEVTYLDSEGIAGVHVRRSRDNAEPWSQWSLYMDVSDEALTADEALVLAAALRRAALRARQLNEAQS